MTFRDCSGDWIICKIEVPVFPCSSSPQHNSMSIYEQLLSSRYIAKGNIGLVSSSSILPFALTDLPIFVLSFFNFNTVKSSREVQENTDSRGDEQDRRGEKRTKQMCFLECG